MFFFSYVDIFLVNWFVGNGWYVYIEIFWLRKMNDIVRFISSFILGIIVSKGKCLLFWYYMYGVDINIFSVYVRIGVYDLMLWFKIGIRGDKWI